MTPLRDMLFSAFLGNFQILLVLKACSRKTVFESELHILFSELYIRNNGADYFHVYLVISDSLVNGRGKHSWENNSAVQSI